MTTTALSTSDVAPPRCRAVIVVAVIATIAVGLASRRFPGMFPALFGKYPGDALWALMVFLGWAFVAPRASTWHLGALAMASSAVVEVSQLYRAPWIVELRATTAGHLVLGTTFAWEDLIAYAVGIAFGMAIDFALRRRRIVCRS